MIYLHDVNKNLPHLSVYIRDLVQSHTIKFNCHGEVLLFKVDISHVHFQSSFIGKTTKAQIFWLKMHEFFYTL